MSYDPLRIKRYASNMEHQNRSGEKEVEVEQSANLPPGDRISIEARSGGVRGIVLSGEEQSDFEARVAERVSAERQQLSNLYLRGGLRVSRSGEDGCSRSERLLDGSCKDKNETLQSTLPRVESNCAKKVWEAVKRFLGIEF